MVDCDLGEEPLGSFGPRVPRPEVSFSEKTGAQTKEGQHKFPRGGMPFTGIVFFYSGSTIPLGSGFGRVLFVSRAYGFLIAWDTAY